MADRRPKTESEDPRVSAAFAEYLQLVDRGEGVPVAEFLARHPDIADDLRSLLVTSEELAQLKPDRPAPETSTRSMAEQNVETIAPQRVQTASSTETVLQRLPDTFGRYRIIRPLGSGAMGDVYLAEDTQLHRQVAIKTPSFDADETGELLERFYREARSAAVVRHSNICPVFDVGEINGRHYISMAYIEGQPLSAYIRPDKLQPERQALVVIRKLALALQEAHDHGIIHRDLKPGNVMIDRKGEPIVMDFGLARPVQSEAGARLTQSGMLVGSPAYMSPEQVEGDTSVLIPATDQYSLGVILYELLTGGLPFRGGITAIIASILTKSPKPPGELRAGLDPRIESLCLKMMAKSPRDRFPSMRAVADAIAAILKSDPDRLDDKPKAAGTPQIAAPRSEPKPQRAQPAAPVTAAAAAASITASNVETLYEAAAKCMRKHDYEQVVQMLDGIPEHKRSDQVRALLKKARELSDEVAFLLAEVDEAMRLNDNEALGKHADALLKLKPRHHKAMQIKEELSRYGGGRIWKAGGWTPDDRRIGEESGITRILLIAGVVFGLTLLSVILYLRVGDAVVRVQINHPDVEVGIQDRTLNIRSANQDIKVDPGEDMLKVSFQGAEFETDKFTLNKGENPALVVELLDKTLSAKFGDLSIGEWPVNPPQNAAEASAIALPRAWGHWTFDAEPLAGDAMGRFKVGGISGEIVPTEGYSGKAMRLLTGGSELRVAVDAPRPFAAVTLAGWVKVDPASGGGRVIGWDSNPGSVTLNVSPTAVNVHLQFNGGRAETKVRVTGNFTVWTHVAGVYDGRWLVLYVNGREVGRAQEEGELPTFRPPLKIGGLLVASFDDLRLYDEALGAEQIAALAGLTTNASNSAAPVAARQTDPAIAALVDAGVEYETDPALPHNPVTRIWSLDGVSDAKLAALLKLLPDLQFIDLDPGITDVSIAALASLPKLRHVKGCAGFTREGLAQLKIMRQLQYLELIHRPIPAEDAAVLATLSQLRQLAFWHGDLADPAIVHLAGLSQLRLLKIQHSPRVTDASVEALGRMANLNRLELRGTGLTSEGVARLRGMLPSTQIITGSDTTNSETDAGWTDLFNGRDLTGWQPMETSGNNDVHRPSQRGWEVKNGELVCTTSKPGWLRSAKQYSDFILHVEFKLQAGSNTDVYIRSPQQGRLSQTGMAVQIIDEHSGKFAMDKPDNRPGAIWGVYGHEIASVTRPLGEWNTLDIRCEDARVQIEVNGRQTVDVDMQAISGLRDRPRSGYIGLANFLGEADGVAFRNIRVQELGGEVAETGGWTDLFNGRDLAGWTPVASDGGWSAENGVLFAVPGDGWLATDRDFGDFELELEYKLAADANSGVFLRAPITGASSGAGMLEVQLLDETATTFRNVADDNRTGALFGLFPASPRADAPPQVWNRLSVRVEGTHITSTVNGVRISDGDLSNAPASALKPDMLLPRGRIGLQRRRQPVEFRNIRIRDLTPGAQAAAPVTNEPTQSPASTLPRNQWIDLDPSAETCTSWNYGEPLKNPQNKLWTNDTLVLDSAAVAYNHIQARDVSIKARVKMIEGQNIALVVRGQHGVGGIYAYIDRVDKERVRVAFLNTKHERTLKVKDEFEYEVTAVGNRSTIKIDDRTVLEDPNVRIMRSGHVETTAYKARGTFKKIQVKILDQ